jgi:hypothetical protein
VLARLQLAELLAHRNDLVATLLSARMLERQLYRMNRKLVSVEQNATKIQSLFRKRSVQAEMQVAKVHRTHHTRMHTHTQCTTHTRTRTRTHTHAHARTLALARSDPPSLCGRRAQA